MSRALIERIRAGEKTDPKLAERLAREDREKSPPSADADERDALLIAAVLNQRQLYRGQDEALRYFREHPGGRFTDEIIRETHMHPPPARADR